MGIHVVNIPKALYCQDVSHIEAFEQLEFSLEYLCVSIFGVHLNSGLVFQNKVQFNVCKVLGVVKQILFHIKTNISEVLPEGGAVTTGGRVEYIRFSPFRLLG